MAQIVESGRDTCTDRGNWISPLIVNTEPKNTLKYNLSPHLTSPPTKLNCPTHHDKPIGQEDCES